MVNVAQPMGPATKEVLGDIEAMYDDALEGIRGRDLVVTENMAFYRGLHWGVAPASGGWIEPEASGEEHEVLNYIRPTVRSAVASMLRNMPQPEAIPMNSDQSSAAKALAVQHLARSLLSNGTVPIETLYRGETEAAVKGACWYKVFYDPNAGRVVNTVGLDGQPRKGFEGAVRVEFRDIIDVLPDPHATNEDEIRHVFDRKMVPVSTLDDRFPVDIDGVQTKGRWSPSQTEPARGDRNAIEQAPRFMYGPFSRYGRATGNALAELREYWEKPTVQRPEGRLVVWCGGVLLVDAPLPYEWPWILRNGQNIVPNALYADGVVLDLKSINRSVNTAATKRLEHIKHATAAQLLVPKDTKITVDHIDDVAGGIVFWDAAQSMQKPEWLQPAQLPAALFEAENQGLSVLKDVSTYSDISRGDAPAGVETGRALAYLHEFSQGVREPDVQMFKWTVVRIVKKCVEIIRDFYPDGRLMRLLGTNNRWMTQPLRRADYDFDADIVVEIDSGAPSSRALRMAEALQVFQVGGFTDDPAAERFRKIISYDYQDRNTIDPKEKAKTRCRGEIQKLVDNPLYPLTVRWQDDHEAYLDVLDDFIQGTEYDVLPPIAQQAIEQYYSAHEVAIAQQQASLAGQNQVLGGGGGANDKAPPPNQPGMASPFDGGTSDAEGTGPSSDQTYQQAPDDGGVSG